MGTANVGRPVPLLLLVPPLLFFLLALSLPNVDARLQQTGDPAAVYFHSLDDAACGREKLVQVDIDGDKSGGPGGGSRVTLKLLESSRDFLPPDATADRQFARGGARPCYYQGTVAGVSGGDSAVAKLSRGLFSATFHHDGVMYEVQPQPAARLTPFRARRLPPPTEPKRRCPLGGAAASAAGDPQRSRRSVLRVDTRSPVPQPAQKFILLLLVGDEAFFKAIGSDVVKAQDRLWEIGNYVNSMYKQLGASVVTVRAVVLSTDPYTLANKTTGVNSIEMLDKFMTYRMQFLGDVTHTAAHLVSGLRMSGADVGLAHLGKLCQYAFGGGVNSDTDITGSALNVAVTLAHELGHNLGMNHDEDDSPCPCPDPQGCIMKAVGGDVNPLRFSTCSVNRYLEFTVNTGLGYCMSRPPEASVKSADAPRCGNKIVEAGEDCDCGPSAWCNNSCCNPSTCKFTSGASCASGQCCNIATCSLVAKGTECRAARTACDLPEFCNGSSEWCPDFDDYVLDGTECAVSTASPGQALAYCHSGDCVTRDRRCEDVFNGTNFRSAPELVSNLTMDSTGSGQGYCSYRPLSYSPLSYEYLPCTFENRRCGTLYCTGTMSDTFPMPRWKSMAPADAMSVVYTVGGATQESQLARLDLRPSGFRDPGLVPNGAECGVGMMCVDSRCLATADVRAGVTAGRGLPNCTSNGRWTQSLQCYCNSGYRPPDCILVGAGGSSTNQPAFAENATVTSAPTTSSGTASSSSSSSSSNSSSGGAYTSAPFVFTTLDQKRDDFWLFVGIGIAAAVVVLLLAIGLAVWLWCWCRRNDTRPFTGGLHPPPPTEWPLTVTDGGDAGGPNGSFPSAKGEKFDGPIVAQLPVGVAGFNGGPPAHLAEFYESVRAAKGTHGRKWPHTQLPV